MGDCPRWVTAVGRGAWAAGSGRSPVQTEGWKVEDKDRKPQGGRERDREYRERGRRKGCNVKR